MGINILYSYALIFNGLYNPEIRTLAFILAALGTKSASWAFRLGEETTAKGGYARIWV